MAIALSLCGILLSLAGSLALAWGLLISQSEAIRLGSSYWSGGSADDQLKLPPVADRLRQSRFARVGVALLVIGSVLQTTALYSPRRESRERWVVYRANRLHSLATELGVLPDSQLVGDELGIAHVGEDGSFIWRLASDRGESTVCSGTLAEVPSSIVVSTDCFVWRLQRIGSRLVPADSATKFMMVRAR